MHFGAKAFVALENLGLDSCLVDNSSCLVDNYRGGA